MKGDSIKYCAIILNLLINWIGEGGGLITSRQCGSDVVLALTSAPPLGVLMKAVRQVISRCLA